MRNGFSTPHGITFANFENIPSLSTFSGEKGESGFRGYVSECFTPAITIDDVAWIKQNTAMPVVIKGMKGVVPVVLP